MVADWAFILGGLALLAVGAEGMVRGSSGLARRMGISALAIGLTVVAFGTGSPELAVSVRSALAGDAGIALGNVVGSNISNVALVLGVAALVRPLRVRPQIIRRELPIMIGASLLLCAMLTDGLLSRFEGGVLLVASIAFVVSSYLMARHGRDRAIAAEYDEVYASDRHPAWLDALMLVGGLAALLAGAELLVTGAVSVAGTLGVSRVVMGLTVVAIGTSVPELATSIAAARRDEADVAIGNAIGSNVLNILAVLGVAALIRPIESAGLRALDLAVMAGSAILLLPLMRRGSVLNRWEGAFLVVGYAIYIATVAA